MTIMRSIFVPFASNPHGIVISHDGSTVYATNAGSGNLTQINVSDNSSSLIALDTLGNPFQSDVSPYLVDISPDDRYLLVTDYAPGGQNIYVIDLLLDPLKPSRVVPIGGRSVHVAFTPDGTQAFACNLEDNTVHVINMSDFSVRTINNVGRQPHGVTFSPDGLRAFVTTENTFGAEPPHHPTSGGEGVSFVYVIEVPTLNIIESIEVGAFGQGIAYAPR
jgi:YVTN family beta-propeller protein